MRRVLVVAGGLIAGALSAQVVQVTVDLDAVKAEVPRTLYGTGMEDVNHEIYGGLDAQRLYDESFEEQEIAPVFGNGKDYTSGWVCGRQWQPLTADGGTVSADRKVRHLGAVSVALKPGSGTAGVANAGLNGWGVPCRKGKPMRGHFYVRGSVGRLEVALQRRDGAADYARAAVTLRETNDWQKVEFVLVPDAIDADARFAIVASGGGEVHVDDAYLADVPTNAFGQMGCREDLVDALRKQGLTFLRWGGTMANTQEYAWRNMKGDRRPYDGYWFRTSSTGFLYREFVQMASLMKLPCAFSIFAYERTGDAVRLAEWLRAFPGDIYVQIGNEECIGFSPTSGECTLGDCRRYCQSLRLLVTAMREANPRLKFVSAMMFYKDRPEIMDEAFRLTDGYADFWDIHIVAKEQDLTESVRADFRAFRDMIARLNPKSKMKAAVLEENACDHGMRRALAHARILGAVREQGDFVLTSCPANAFQPCGQNDNGWDQGQVFFTPDRVWLQPCGWAQQMAAANHRDILVEGTSDDGEVEVSATRDRDGRDVVLHLVNRAQTARKVRFDFGSNRNPKLAGVTVLSAAGPDDDNPPDDPLKISPRDGTDAFARSSELLPNSYTVVRFTCGEGVRMEGK